MSHDHPYIDFDGDGHADHYQTEELGEHGHMFTSYDAHGNVHAIGYDENGDGLLESVDMDTNGDGVLDMHATDTNGDGWMDTHGAYSDASDARAPEENPDPNVAAHPGEHTGHHVGHEEHSSHLGTDPDVSASATNDRPWIDFDGDGRGDQYETIHTAHGNAFVHDDGTGHADAVAYDFNRDGILDAADIASHGDGVIDTHVIDTNGDGWMDTTTGPDHHGYASR